MYAVIRSGGKQYKVSEGDIINVQNLNSKDSKVVFEDVLFLSKDGGTKVGKPNISGVKVSAKILENKKGEKIRVAKFKSKVRFRRVTGFRPQITVVQIEKISVK